MAKIEEEMRANCPYCGSPITFLCDPSSGGQTYVEDCEVCCRPIQISFETIENDNQITGFSVSRLD